ncbi:hypothetical protein LO80_04970 [Candidatus Francisella endociliophora]|uniref:Uncharacterized protein n=2 Tax=Candidatus Francisella endociliophora TaxID=653937 RepID=A0A097EP91_9GAMM|nr:hypothetical protein LO80_04970 [Francisella sp. FSC1006]
MTTSFGYAKCDLVKAKSGVTGEIVFKCNKDTSLIDNKLSFKIKANHKTKNEIIGISNVWIDKAYANYDITNENGFNVEANFYKTWTQNNPYIAEANKKITLKFDITDKNEKHYDIEWGGINLNSTSQQSTNPCTIINNNKSDFSNSDANTRLELKCNNQELVDENAIVLYIDSKKNDNDEAIVNSITNIWVSGSHSADARYTVEQVSDTRKKVVINIYKWWPQDEGYKIVDGSTLKINISYWFNSWPFYYTVSLPEEDQGQQDPEQTKEINAYQFKRDLSGLIYTFKDELFCLETSDCKPEKLYIDYKCEENGNCEAIDRLNEIRLGIISEKEL